MTQNTLQSLSKTYFRGAMSRFYIVPARVHTSIQLNIYWKNWNSNDFFAALQETWAQLPLKKLTFLVNSMPRRCGAVIATNSYSTKY